MTIDRNNCKACRVDKHAPRGAAYSVAFMMGLVAASDTSNRVFLLANLCGAHASLFERMLTQSHDSDVVAL